jgi:hypothetical protein
MGWLFSLLGGGLLDGIFKVVVQPFLQAYLKSKDVDLEKFKIASTSTTALAVAVLDANVKYASIKSQYALAVLNWWPFRVILFCLLAFCASRFCLIVFDSTYWWVFGCTINGHHVIGDACSWSFPPINGIYGGAEMQFLLFWVIAKPVDTAVSGAIDLVSKYMRK